MPERPLRPDIANKNPAVCWRAAQPGKIEVWQMTTYPRRSPARKRRQQPIFRIHRDAVFDGRRAIGRIVESDGWTFQARGHNDGPIGEFLTYRRAAVEVVQAAMRMRWRQR
jgi:hypothetical protein